MHNLIHMDLYRMRKGLVFKICLGLALLMSLAQTPLIKLLSVLSAVLGESGTAAFAAEANLSSILRDPFPMISAMLAMLSVTSFFYADQEYGYIKNIAGQMPKRGYTVLSKFVASIPHNLMFLLVGIVGNLIGTVLFRRIVVDGAMMDAIRVCLLRFLLLQGICAVLLLVTASLRSKSLGIVLSVLFGTGMLMLFYGALDSALHQIPFLKDFSLMPYMPDQLLSSESPDTVTALLSAAVSAGVFLPLAIRVFDRRDIK